MYVQLRLKKVVRYLGVDIDQRMSFTSHVIRLKAYSEKLTAMLRRLMPNVKEKRVLIKVINLKIIDAAPV